MFQGLLYTHDKVAIQKSQQPKATPTDDDERDYIYERASQYGEESIKIVRLQKTADPLVGFFVCLFYILATSKVISGQIQTCDSAHSW